MSVSEYCSDKTLASATKIAKTVSQIAGALVSLSALGFFIGWRETSSYFNALGAPWAASDLPASMLLQSSSSLVVTLAVSTYIAVSYLANGHASSRGLGWATVTCLALAFALYLLTLFESLGLVARTIYNLATCAGFLFAVAAGITLAELIARYRDSDSQFHPPHLWLVYWMLSLGLLQAPDKLGQARAAYHLDVKSEGLPVALPPGASSTETWKLVYMSDGRALLMLPSAQRDKTIFRLIEAKELLSVRSTLVANK